MRELHLYAEDFTTEQIRELMPILLPYSVKVVNVRPVTGEFYDYILTVQC